VHTTHIPLPQPPGRVTAVTDVVRTTTGTVFLIPETRSPCVLPVARECLIGCFRECWCDKNINTNYRSDRVHNRWISTLARPRVEFDNQSPRSVGYFPVFSAKQPQHSVKKFVREERRLLHEHQAGRAHTFCAKSWGYGAKTCADGWNTEFVRPVRTHTHARAISDPYPDDTHRLTRTTRDNDPSQQTSRKNLRTPSPQVMACRLLAIVRRLRPRTRESRNRTEPRRCRGPRGTSQRTDVVGDSSGFSSCYFQTLRFTPRFAHGCAIVFPPFSCLIVKRRAARRTAGNCRRRFRDPCATFPQHRGGTQ